MRNAAQAWASTVCGVARGDMFISRWCSGDSGGGGGGGGGIGGRTRQSRKEEEYQRC